MHAEGSSILQFESRGEIGIATLNRPERLNAFDDELIETLLQFFASLENDYETRVLILTGAGRAFCAGLDLTPGAIADPYLAEDAKLGKVGYGFWFQKRIAEIVLRMRRCPQPILGAVHGPAVGGGMSIALACDLRVASPEAKFACSFLNLGVGGGDMGSSYFLTTLLGPSRAADMMYSGRMVLAEEALQLGAREPGGGEGTSAGGSGLARRSDLPPLKPVRPPPDEGAHQRDGRRPPPRDGPQDREPVPNPCDPD